MRTRVVVAWQVKGDDKFVTCWVVHSLGPMYSPLPVLYGERARVRGGRLFERVAAPHPNPLPIKCRNGERGRALPMQYMRRAGELLDQLLKGFLAVLILQMTVFFKGVDGARHRELIRQHERAETNLQDEPQLR